MRNFLIYLKSEINAEFHFSAFWFVFLYLFKIVSRDRNSQYLLRPVGDHILEEQASLVVNWNLP